MQRKGFTLIELLVVVLIIGILAAIALPQYQFAVEKARLAEPLTIASNLRRSIDVWLLSNDYPSSSNFLYFLGDSANSKGSLDIDIESIMDCSDRSDEDNSCRTQNFSYSAGCDQVCWVTISRRVPDGRYYFRYFKDRSTGKWKGDECDCYDEYPVGVKVCKWLVSLGEGHFMCHGC